MKKLIIMIIILMTSIIYADNNKLTYKDRQYYNYIKANNPKISNKETLYIMQEVYKNSYKYKVSKQLIFAIIKVESNFKHDLTSNKDAFGYMQIMRVLEKDKKGNRKTRSGNIELGVSYLRDTIDAFGLTNKAIAAYNKGIYGVKKSGYSNKETSEYVIKVRKELSILNSMLK